MVQLLVFLMGIVKKSFTEKKEIAPVAQLDRASDFGSEGSGFESLRAHLLLLIPCRTLWIRTCHLLSLLIFDAGNCCF